MKKVLFFAGIFLYVNSSIAQVSSATFGTMEARQLGPGTMSGRITAIDGSASDGKTIYVGTAGGGIWKSTNAGASFKPIFDKYCQSIGAVAINQSNPNIIFAGTGESLSLIHISEPTRLGMISYAVFCLKKKKTK